MSRLLHLLALALLLGGCATRPDTRSADPVLLISIDGLRADYLERGLTPNLSRIAGEGVRAQWMNPSYPSLTFPNHYSIVTGLRPDHHGIVHNSMSDAQLGTFRLSDREAVGDPRWWGGEPIWIGAIKSGQRAATLFWPGSEAPIGGIHPTYWKPYDGSVSYDARVDEVLGWLSQPASTRPRVVTLYFDHVDHEGHSHGPDSPQVRDALVDADRAIGRLLDGLDARGLRVNLIVVSDHGMAAVTPERLLAIEDMVTMEEAEVTSLGQVIGINPNPGLQAQVERKLLGAHAQYDCWRKGELPAHWHYGTHPRIAAIVCQMHEGWDVLPREAIAKRQTGETRGSHGFDPALPSMRAIFIAHGPAFRQGVVLPAFDNIDVYPLLARLAGITPAPNDGNAQTLLPALKDTK
ncbi:MAG: ectonucleotide pyrophosphatase/phosphodiesterase [Thermomonas sp.]|uniref:alkaline phosphatase family protein n=1 Tax=Thermomonas sp. TaxID=1971895 RepID=UPI0039E30734